MKDEEKSAQNLAAIQNELLHLFGDFCQRSPVPGVAALVQEFKAHRLSLVFTVAASMDETSVFCGMVPTGEGPAEMQTLFTVHSPASTAPSRGLH